jgi:hypothetical protein
VLLTTLVMNDSTCRNRFNALRRQKLPNQADTKYRNCGGICSILGVAISSNTAQSIAEIADGCSSHKGNLRLSSYHCGYWGRWLANDGAFIRLGIRESPPATDRAGSSKVSSTLSPPLRWKKLSTALTLRSRNQPATFAFRLHP